ncbi:hypothetical protein ILUMI_24716 [Ignelater luminosus]|uniref:Uncharacterized protein n=1 Tax=Ignelater luminosus TaxID=2038154 RepID=A0A8K0FWH0_IGNLU|nr:hypothetical protein ILUMI_24716 [Ignelater luminosus]
MKKLLEMKLFNNTIENVKEGTFDGLTRLNTVALDENSIKKFSFEGNHSIRTLVIKGTMFEGLEGYKFHGLYLETLLLTHFNLSKIVLEPFNNLESLLELHLEANQINDLDENSFVGLDNLEQLNLQNNNIKVLPTRLKHLSSLQYLLLQNNSLEQLENDQFELLGNLLHLYLSTNKIVELSKHSFRGLEKLMYLDLSYNYIKVLPKEIFYHNNEIVSIDLRSNRLVNIDINVFKFNKQLECACLAAKRLAKTRKLCSEMPQEYAKNSLNESIIDEVDITFDDGVFDVVQDSEVNKDEVFEAEGPIIVNIRHLFAYLKAIKHLGFGCSFLDVEILGERRLGLESIFIYKCAMCELLGSFATEGENSSPNINEIAASGAFATGIEYFQFS